jgi:hypothetical protein
LFRRPNTTHISNALHSATLVSFPPGRIAKPSCLHYWW